MKSAIALKKLLNFSTINARNFITGDRTTAIIFRGNSTTLTSVSSPKSMRGLKASHSSENASLTGSNADLKASLISLNCFAIGSNISFATSPIFFNTAKTIVKTALRPANIGFNMLVDFRMNERIFPIVGIIPAKKSPTGAKRSVTIFHILLKCSTIGPVRS